MRTVHALYYVSILVAILLVALAPDNVAWKLSLLSTGWVGGLTFAIVQRPVWLFRMINRLP